MSPLLIAVTVLFLMCAVAMSLYVALYGSHRVMQERFDEMTLQLRTAQIMAHGGELMPDSVGRSLLQWALQRVPAPKKNRATEKLAKALVQAGFRRSNAVRIFLLIRVAAIGAGSVLGLLAGTIFLHAGSKTMLATMMGAGIGFYGPMYYLRKRAANRQQNISRELSDVLDLLVVCIEAGLGLFEAIKVVGDETLQQGQAIGQELSLVAGEVAAGASLGQGLRSLADRTAVEDVRPLAATLIQSEQLGAQVGPALRSSSDSLRLKRRFRAEEAAQKSTVKILFPLVLFILPAMMMVIVGPAIV
ncbi:MAG TPA: type II secretion system F family protein, partial [Candidatus Binataceae bacterium]|nr:type II secretion system F family protein [Candidatus Binataceae bacterium]